jgi:hypothetical protein
VQTADTGQINWATVTRPGTNTDGGYEIWRFDDTHQATAPVFFRVNYGTYGTATRPRLTIIVGTSSNGSGTIGGVTVASTIINVTADPTSSATNYTTRACAVDGAFGFMWGLGANASVGYAFLGIFRSVDSSGAANADAVQIYMTNTATAGTLIGCHVIRYATADTVQMTAATQCLVHGGVASSLVGGKAQVYKHYMATPRVRPHPWLLTVINTEIGNNTQFTATAVGVTSRNYVSSGSEGYRGTGVAAPTSNAYSIAMIWE